MTVPLSEELRKALLAHPNEPLYLVDDATQSRYILKPVDEDDFDIKDTYRAQEEAVREVWSHPGLDVYDNDDAPRHKP